MDIVDFVFVIDLYLWTDEVADPSVQPKFVAGSFNLYWVVSCSSSGCRWNSCLGTGSRHEPIRVGRFTPADDNVVENKPLQDNRGM